MNHAWMTQATRRTLLAAAALATTLGCSLAHAGEGYVKLSAKGKTVLEGCNPKSLPARERCRVAELPGEPGYTLVASNSEPLVKNEVTIGTVYDQVWANEAGDHIFGARVELNAEPFDLSGLSFNLNDLFRKVLAEQPVSVAYQYGPAVKALKKAGRTLQGTNEPDPDDDDDDDLAAANALQGNQPTRNNAWVDFRIDANAADPDGVSSASSPWLLVKTRAPAGFSLKPFGIRALNSNFDEPSQIVEIYVPAYAPN